MLKKLDRYIIGKYLATFFFTILIFTQISIVIDLSDKIEDFLSEPVTTWQIIRDYYLPYIPYINGLLIPLYALISVIFFTSRMAYNSEIISILNAGVSYRRLMWPYLVAGLFIAGLHLFCNHMLIPWSNKTRLDFEHTYIWKYNDKGKTHNVHMFLEPGTKIFMKYYKKKDSLGRDFRMEKILNHEIKSLLSAKTIKWIGPPGKWKLTDYQIRGFNGQKESILLGAGESIDTTLNLTPQDFVRFTNQKEMMDTREMQAFIETERARGVGNTKVFEIEIHRRTSEPVTILILTFIGMAVSSRKVRGGMGFQLALGIAIGALFIFLSKFSMTFATNDNLPAVLGVWIPNIIFSFVAFFLIFNAQK